MRGAIGKEFTIPILFGLTVLSPENLKVARTLFPHIRSEFIPFGINVDELAPLKKEKIHHPVRILSIGNDPHRDWQILI